MQADADAVGFTRLRRIGADLDDRRIEQRTAVLEDEDEAVVVELDGDVDLRTLDQTDAVRDVVRDQLVDDEVDHVHVRLWHVVVRTEVLDRLEEARQPREPGSDLDLQLVVTIHDRHAVTSNRTNTRRSGRERQAPTPIRRQPARYKRPMPTERYTLRAAGRRRGCPSRRR